MVRSLSWYCRRLAGEISWKEGTLRVSTLTMWGHRHDEYITEKRLSELGFSAERTEGNDQIPPEGLLNLTLDEHTFLLFNSERHIKDPQALGRLASGKLPFEHKASTSPAEPTAKLDSSASSGG
mmetsp:Transcript_25474/g.38398  ORF Transcript_25474/g.38398 Transcript_25474/m.38398 type:complete len:124 (+) Transcript_25474:3-374(+)